MFSRLWKNHFFVFEVFVGILELFKFYVCVKLVCVFKMEFPDSDPNQIICIRKFLFLTVCRPVWLIECLPGIQDLASKSFLPPSSSPYLSTLLYLSLLKNVHFYGTTMPRKKIKATTINTSTPTTTTTSATMIMTDNYYQNASPTTITTSSTQTSTLITITMTINTTTFLTTTTLITIITTTNSMTIIPTTTLTKKKTTAMQHHQP